MQLWHADKRLSYAEKQRVSYGFRCLTRGAELCGDGLMAHRASFWAD